MAAAMEIDEEMASVSDKSGGKKRFEVKKVMLIDSWNTHVLGKYVNYWYRLYLIGKLCFNGSYCMFCFSCESFFTRGSLCRQLCGAIPKELKRYECY